MAGSEQTIPVQDIVSIVHSSGFPPQDTNTAGNGYSMVAGLFEIFDIALIFSRLSIVA